VRSAEFAETGRMTLVEVAVGRSGGGGFRFTPDADPADGLLDVCVVRAVGLARFVTKVPSVIRGTHAGLPEVALFRTRAVQIRALDGPLHLHLDGEFRAAPESAAVVTVEPGRLRVLLAE
jgi:diacylglycerol kinase (ATP)